MNILFMTKYSRKGASTRLRSLQYVPYLESQGFKVKVSNLFDDKYLEKLYKYGKRAPFRVIALYVRRFLVLFKAYKYDLIWIEKEIFPYAPAIFERLFRWFGKAYVVDYDDAIFHNYDMLETKFWRRLLGRKIDVVMRNATCVIVGNDYLKKRSEFAGCSCIELVPTVVDLTRYNLWSAKSAVPLVIGWVGSPSTQKYVTAVAEALSYVCKRYDAKLLLIGASSDISPQFPDLDLEIVPWDETSEVELINRMDIGIMPLPDGPWERGKCGYKLIQYMACGIPVIASPVGVNVDIVQTGQCGFLADGVKEWEFALNKLLESPEMRKGLGEAGRKAVENRYSLQTQAPILASILSNSIVIRSHF